MFPFFNRYPGTDLHEIDLAYVLKQTINTAKTADQLSAWASQHQNEYNALARKVNGLIDNLIDVVVPWDSSKAYDIFSIVEYQGVNYIAVQDVPVGAMITDTNYWQPANTVVEQINAIAAAVNDFTGSDTTYIFPSNWDGQNGNACLAIVDDKKILFDCYTIGCWTDLKAMLDSYSATHLDYFILSHFHRDHAGNIENLINNGYIDSNTVIYFPVLCRQLEAHADAYARYQSALALMASEGISYTVPLNKSTIYVNDNYSISFFNTDSNVLNDASYSDEYNECCMVALCRQGNTSALFTGDAGLSVLPRTLTENFINEPITLYMIEHHGMNSTGQMNRQFMQKIRPTYALHYSSAYILQMNSYVRCSTLQYLQENSIPIYSCMDNDDYIVFKANNISMECVQGVATQEIAAQPPAISIYVDASVDENAIQDGTQAHPFKNFTAALGAINPRERTYINVAAGEYNTLGTESYTDLNNVLPYVNSNVLVQIIGTTNDPDDVIIHIRAESRIVNCDFVCSYVTFQYDSDASIILNHASGDFSYCKFTGGTRQLLAQRNSSVSCQNCTFTGSATAGVQVVSNSIGKCTSCTFSNSGTNSISVTDTGVFINTGNNTLDRSITRGASGVLVTPGEYAPAETVKYAVINPTITSVTIAAGTVENVMTSYDVTNALADATEILNVGFLWASGTACVPLNINWTGTTINRMNLYNLTSASVNVSSVRLAITYK